MQRSALLRAELEDAMAGMTPAARAVFEDIQERDEDADPNLPEDFHALTPIERTSVIGAAKLLNDLAEAETAEEADDQKQPVGVSRLERQLWIGSVLISLAFLIAVGGRLEHVYTAPMTPDRADTVVTTPDEVTRFLDAHVPPPHRGAEPPVFIPTGLYIESIQFSGPYTLDVAGHIWQRYANQVPQDVTKGVLFPEAKEQPTLKEEYRERQGNDELIGWSFHTTLREQFDYSKYPLGRQQIWLRMWHPDYERNVYLTPDIGAYTSLVPAELPGVDRDLVLENWDIQQSFFSYRTHRYNTHFGIPSYEADQLHPELYYSIAVKRYLWSPLISRTIVPIVILIDLFLVVSMLGARGSKRREIFGMLPYQVIFTGAAFVFAVLISQTSLRDEVKPSGLVYIETLYVVTYFIILGVSINSVLLAGWPNFKLFRHHGNMWVRVLYWPVTLLTILVITLLTFH
jgi:hypothetical protein